MSTNHLTGYDHTDKLQLAKTQRDIQLSNMEEKFCNLVADGLQQSYAYQELHSKSSFDTCASNASRLMRKPHIVARIAQLRAEAIEGFEVSRNFLLENLLWALNASRERGSTDQVRKIIMDIGKVFGLVIEKSEADVLHRFQVMKDVTVNGDTLNFDIGDGQVVDVKGEHAEDVEIPKKGRKRKPKEINAAKEAELLDAEEKRKPTKRNPKGAGRKAGIPNATRVAGRKHKERKAALQLAQQVQEGVELSGEELL